MISLKKRLYANQAMDAKVGETVTLAGWVEQIRVLGKLAFIILRDRTGKFQLTFLGKNFPNIAELTNLTRESIIVAQGKLSSGKSKQFAKELLVSKMEILNKAETPLPIEFIGDKIETGLSKRLDNRFLDLRDPKKLAIFRIRQKAFAAVHEFFAQNGFIETQTPKLVFAGAEGGAETFVMSYFGKKAYLSQSQQLYKQMMMATGFDKVYEIGPTFRAEKSRTMRHLAEFSHLDVEMAFIDSEEDVYKVEEKLLMHIVRYIQRNCKNELAILEKTVSVPKTPFPRISHEGAVKLLQKSGVKIKAEEDIDLEGEKKLGVIIKKKYGADAYFLTNFPWKLKVCKFYWMKNGNVGRGSDLEYMGQELTTGSQREHRYDVLVKQIKERGLNPREFVSYLHPFKFGMPPHGGFGWGMDRLLSYVLGIENIREVVLFPRDTERLTP